MSETEVRAVFREQARSCTAMGSPFTGRVCALLAEQMTPGDAVADKVLDWPGDASSQGATVALRLTGALHGLVLEAKAPALVAAYPPHLVDNETLWAAISAALTGEADYLLARLELPPQTNEPQRSAALCPGFLTVAALTGGLPIVTSELGASAGLNLSWDRFHYRFGDAPWGDPRSPVRFEPDWQGPPPPLSAVQVAGRAACDLAPIDATSREGALRLLSFIWPDQTERLARIAAAIEVARAGDVRVERADAADWLEHRLGVEHRGEVHVVYHSIIWTYLPAETQTRITALLTEAGAGASPDAPLAWLRLEGGDADRGAEITLTLWPSGETRTLGRASHHGAWVRWTGWS